jgi:hypothetical protein
MSETNASLGKQPGPRRSFTEASQGADDEVALFSINQPQRGNPFVFSEDGRPKTEDSQ